MTSVLIEFVIFVFMQSLLINGAYECFNGNCLNDMNTGRKCDGNIFFKINPEWFVRNKKKIWALPLFGCVKCMASVWGSITFWVFVPMAVGFHWQEIFVWPGDLLILVTLNWWVYKKL